MFDKVSQMAEPVATKASRREFLGRFGRGAMIAAAAVGGILALPGRARAGKKGLLCGSGGALDCAGAKTGDTCYIDGVAGTCQFDNTDVTPPDACACVVRGGGKPH